MSLIDDWRPLRLEDREGYLLPPECSVPSAEVPPSVKPGERPLEKVLLPLPEAHSTNAGWAGQTSAFEAQAVLSRPPRLMGGPSAELTRNRVSFAARAGTQATEAAGGVRQALTAALERGKDLLVNVATKRPGPALGVSGGVAAAVVLLLALC